MNHPDYFAEPFTRIQAWMDLLLIANHSEGRIYKRGNLIIINRGEVGYSKERLADRWQWNRKKVTKFLDRLELDGQIVQEMGQQNTQQKNRLLSKILIVNYDEYQRNGTTEYTTEGQQKVQQKDTNNNDNKKNNAKNKIKKDTIVSPKVCDVDFEYIFNVWKELVGLCPNIKPITKLTDSRKKKLLKRFSENRENFQEMYKKSLQNIVDSDYLQGSKGWIITFDWLIHSETNFTKVYEGNYNNGGTSKANDREAMLAEVDRLGEQERLIREYSRRKLQTGTV